MILLITITICSIEIANAFPKFDGDYVVAETDQGKLRGRIDMNYWNEPFFSFEAVPYAQPPIGKLRFKAPQPPLPWEDDIRDAVEPGPACVQFNGQGSEDCLILSIHSKMENEKLISGDLRPVMVWIHGGSFKFGSISNDLYGPEFLNDDVGVSGNAGLKDQVMALKWVQKNIENFGGDPNQVTIFGESAGGASTHLLCLSPMAKGLFHRVIAQSGCGLDPWVFSKVVPQKNFFEMVDCGKDDLKDVLQCLEKVPADQLVKKQRELKFKTKQDFLVVIENSMTEEKFLSENVDAMIKHGNFNQIPFLAGYVPQEGAFLYDKGLGMKKGNNPLNENLIPKIVNIDLNSDEAKKLNDKIKGFYFKNRNSTEEIMDGYIAYLSDYAITERLYTVTKWHALKSTAPVYYYKFNYDTSLNLRVKMFPQNYVTHADDLAYLFTKNSTPKKLSETSIEMQGIKRMIKMWAQFAKTGNPNPLQFEDEQYTGHVEWKPVTAENFYYLIIQPSLKLAENPEEERMKFWENLWADLNL